MLSLRPYSFVRNFADYDPFRALEAMEPAFRGVEQPMFRTDIRETENAYELEADLPGYKKEDIRIEVEEDRLTLTAERKKEERAGDKKDGYTHFERSFGSCTRSFDLNGIDTAAITAAYTDGVLKITMPKQPEEKTEKRILDIA